MVEPFAAEVLSTFFPGRVYLKHTSGSVVRTIGVPSFTSNFSTHTARGVKGNTYVENPNCHVWDSREWACSSKIFFSLINVLIR